MNNELAQLNIAKLKAPIDSPLLVDFVSNLDRINLLAESSHGFVWRLQTEEGNATAAITPFGEEYIVNMSVWDDVESLYKYVFESAHLEIMKRRREWFEVMGEAFSVMWWVEKGHRPSLDEAKERLDLFQKIGPSSDAFTFKHPFPAPDPE